LIYTNLDYTYLNIHNGIGCGDTHFAADTSGASSLVGPRMGAPIIVRPKIGAELKEEMSLKPRIGGEVRCWYGR